MSYFAELVFGSNLAIHKHVMSSYPYQSGVKAVDGDPRGDSHTSNTCVSYYQYLNQPAFLRIDLGHVYPISHVDIFPATYRKGFEIGWQKVSIWHQIVFYDRLHYVCQITVSVEKQSPVDSPLQ